MFNQLKRIKYKLNNYYIYDSKKAFKETIKFYISDKKTVLTIFTSQRQEVNISRKFFQLI